MACVVPVASPDRGTTLADALEIWSSGSEDTELAEILEQVRRTDEPPNNAWDS